MPTQCGTRSLSKTEPKWKNKLPTVTRRAKSTARAWYYSGIGSTTFLYYSHVYIALDKSMY